MSVSCFLCLRGSVTGHSTESVLQGREEHSDNRAEGEAGVLVLGRVWGPPWGKTLGTSPRLSGQARSMESGRKHRPSTGIASLSSGSSL